MAFDSDSKTHSTFSKRRAKGAPAPTCVDLFAGAGGFSLAAVEAGFEVEFAIENERHAGKTFTRNIKNASGKPITFYQNNIEHLDPTEICARHFSNGSQCDVVFGGPPCQGFSTHRLKNSGVDDPRNSLVQRYFEFVQAIKPKVFLMENVPGMLWPRHKNYVDNLYNLARASGFRVFPPEILDARDYGVPQRRKRVFILGIRDDLSPSDVQWPITKTHTAHPARALDKQDRMQPWQTSAHCFAPAIKNDPCDIHMNHSPELVSAFRSTPKNGGSRHQSNRQLECHKGHSGHRDVYGRIDPSEPAPTMTTACVNPSKGRFVHPTQHHGITVRQAARIQTFPDHFVFMGGLMAAGRQIGNAVPIELGRRIAEEIKKLCQTTT